MPAPAAKVLPSGDAGQEPFPAILEALEQLDGNPSPAKPPARTPKESEGRARPASPQASRTAEDSSKARDIAAPLTRPKAPAPPASAEAPAPPPSASTAPKASPDGSAGQPTPDLQPETAAETGDPSPPEPASRIDSFEPQRDYASAVTRGPFSEIPPATLWGSANQAAASPWSRSRSDAPASDSRKSEPPAGSSEPRMAAFRNAPESQPVFTTRTAYDQAVQPAVVSGQTAQPDPGANAWLVDRTRADITGASESPEISVSPVPVPSGPAHDGRCHDRRSAQRQQRRHLLLGAHRRMAARRPHRPLPIQSARYPRKKPCGPPCRRGTPRTATCPSSTSRRMTACRRLAARRASFPRALRPFRGRVVWPASPNRPRAARHGPVPPNRRQLTPAHGQPLRAANGAPAATTRQPMPGPWSVPRRAKSSPATFPPGRPHLQPTLPPGVPSSTTRQPRATRPRRAESLRKFRLPPLRPLRPFRIRT